MERKTMKKIQVLFCSFLVLSFLIAGCQQTSKTSEKDEKITKQEVKDAEKKWGDAIVSIGKAYTRSEDYKKVAKEKVDELYGFEDGTVLFKPTKASKDQFRLTEKEALSYFVGGEEKEDHGFALNPWAKVRFENEGILIDSDSATAMGNYYFTDAKTGKEVKVEYTFEYYKDDKGDLRIKVHHSSLPYVPTHE